VFYIITKIISGQFCLIILQIEFEDLGHSGPDHFRVYNFRAVVGDVYCDKGSGRTKKDAKREAAAIALRSLGYQVSAGTNT